MRARHNFLEVAAGKWPKEDAGWQVPRAPLTGINHAIYALQVRFMSGSWQIQVRCLSSATEFVCYDFFMVSARQKIPRWRRRAFSLRIGSFNWSVAISLKPKPHSTCCPSEGKQLCANNTSLMSAFAFTRTTLKRRWLSHFALLVLNAVSNECNHARTHINTNMQQH